jgi:trk system potassium uptake protein TrkA
MYIIIAGAGIIGSQIAKILVKNQHNVVVIDKNKEVCDAIYNETGALTILGSATKLRDLQKAGAKYADLILCLMGDDADNISTALLARSLGIKKIIARLRKPSYRKAYELSGVTTIVDVSEILLDKMIIEVENPILKKVYRISNGKANVYALRITQKSRAVGMSIKDIATHKKFPEETVFMGILKKTGDFNIPRGNYKIQNEDLVFLVSKDEYIEQVKDFLTKEKVNIIKSVKNIFSKGNKEQK